MVVNGLMVMEGRMLLRDRVVVHDRMSIDCPIVANGWIDVKNGLLLMLL
jgi:hypothetical protein